MSLRKKIAKVLQQYPQVAPYFEELTKTASLPKTAVNPKTVDFLTYVFSTQDTWTEQEVERFLRTDCRLDILPPLTRDTSGPRFKKGDRVKVQAEKHKDPETLSTYAEYDGKIGTVTETEGMDVLVKLDSVAGPEIRFPNAMAPRGVGLYKHTDPFVLTGSPPIEIVYLAAPDSKPSNDQKAVVEKYEKGGKKGESRPVNYYTGHAFSARESKEGKIYFQLFPQQRMTIGEGGFEPRSFSPSKGKVLYMGLIGKRPKGWEQKLEALKEEAGDN